MIPSLCGVRQLLSLRRDASVETLSGGGIALAAGFRRAVLGRLPEPSMGVLRRLADEPATEAELVDAAGGASAGTALFAATLLVQRLQRSGWLDETLASDGRLLLSLRPHVAGRPFAAAAEVTGHVALSRFAHLRREGSHLLIDAPQARAVVVAHDRAITGLVHELARPREVADLVGAELGLADDVLPGALRALHTAGVLTRVEDGRDPEQDEPRWRQWSFHDLLFHGRSRAGRTSAGYGGTFHLAAELPPLPTVPAPTGAVQQLAPVELGLGAAALEPFGAVLERRHSVRAHDDAHPITREELGELLFRTLRERRVLRGVDGEDASDRPYPSGGALYELDVYAAVRSCIGLVPGIHRYVADRHALELVTADSPAVVSFIELAGRTALFERPPQVILVITGRFGRVMRKYESMPYALMLKHVGVVYQSLYLTATAMNLAPCGLGGGDSDRFAELTGRDPLAEASLGEFVIGSDPGRPA